MLSCLRLLVLLSIALLPAVSLAQNETFPPPKSLGSMEGRGRNIQRTMRLLATSTPEHRHTVKILFYGQSITEQKWTKIVTEDLKRRFPNANLIIENRAIGAHASQLLVKTAEADLYPFQPDLVIFYVYGAHDKYEDILRTIREKTTAEILQQNDHLRNEAEFDEPTDAEALGKKRDPWNAFMNHNWLPAMASKYSTEYVDQRSLWKQYLRDHDLKAATLLSDGVHLNDHGNFLMAEIVKSYLRYDPTLGPSPAEKWVRTYEVGKDLGWRNGKLQFEFDGGRIDAVCGPGMGPAAAIRIDGRKPSEFAESYAFTRTSAYPGLGWPCLLRVRSQAKLVPETWTATLSDNSPDFKTFRFKVRGSVTGEDGEGEATSRFVSKSGRIVIEPDDWNMVFSHRVKPASPPPGNGFEVKWQSTPLSLDEFRKPADTDPAIESLVTLAQGLPNGKHVLVIEGTPAVPIAVIRVHRPPLQPASAAH